MFVAALASASSLFRDEYVMKGTILEVKLIERGKIEVEQSYTALDGKNGSVVEAKGGGASVLGKSVGLRLIAGFRRGVLNLGSEDPNASCPILFRL